LKIKPNLFVSDCIVEYKAMTDKHCFLCYEWKKKMIFDFAIDELGL